jgi:hypothetical protein
MGTLAVMTEVALKVLPAQRECTVLCLVLPTDRCPGIERGLGTPYEVSGTACSCRPRAFDQEIANAGASVTAIRVENFPALIRYRSSRLKHMMQAMRSAELDTARSRIFWNEVRTFADVPEIVPARCGAFHPARDAPKLIGAIARKTMRAFTIGPAVSSGSKRRRSSDAGAEICRTLPNSAVMHTDPGGGAGAMSSTCSSHSIRR